MQIAYSWITMLGVFWVTAIFFFSATNVQDLGLNLAIRTTMTISASIAWGLYLCGPQLGIKKLLYHVFPLVVMIGMIAASIIRGPSILKILISLGLFALLEAVNILGIISGLFGASIPKIFGFEKNSKEGEQ